MGRNRAWQQLWARDIISMPDAWEYPWFAAWESRVPLRAMARFDPQFAKHHCCCWPRVVMHPNGQLPAYEFAFGDCQSAGPRVAVWRVYSSRARPASATIASSSSARR